MRLQARLNGAWTDLLVPVRSMAALKKDPFFNGAYLMAPWCNRLPKARFRFRGTSHRLRPNFPDGSAIHGDVHARAWRVVRQSAVSFEAELDSRRARAFNFPWPVVVRHGVRLSARGVSAWISVRNVGDADIPAGVGFHPFFRRSLSKSGADIEIPPQRRTSLARRVYDEGHRLTGHDIRLSYADPDVVVLLRPGKNAKHLFVWAPKTFRGRAATFACVEPMTMKAGGFEGRDMKVLKPGETLRMAWLVEARTI